MANIFIVAATAAKAVGAGLQGVIVAPLYGRRVKEKEENRNVGIDLIKKGNVDAGEKVLRSLRFDTTTQILQDVKTFFRGVWYQYIVKHRMAQVITLISSLLMLAIIVELTITFWELTLFSILIYALYRGVIYLKDHSKLVKNMTSAVTRRVKDLFTSAARWVHDITVEQERLEENDGALLHATEHEGPINEFLHNINDFLANPMQVVRKHWRQQDTQKA